MKILHVTQKLPGGPASYLGEILPYQRSLFGAGNVLINACAEETSHLPDFPDRDFRKFRSSSRAPRPLLAFLRQAIEVIREEKPDLVHLHSSFSGLLRLPISRLPDGIRPAVVYCPHGWSFNIATHRLRKLAYALIERMLAARADVSVVISRFDYQSAIAFGLPAGNMHIVRNGIDQNCPPLIQPSARFDPAKINLVFIGRLDRQKGFDVLREAMEQITREPIHLHMLGANVVDATEKGKWSDVLPNVTMYGWIPRREVFGFIEAADAIVMPSRWEGFGLAAIEAMRQGKPVIASEVDALPEVIGDTGLLVPTADSAALARTLANLDRSSLERLGGKARDRFVANFTAERLNRELVEVYGEALALRYGAGLRPVPSATATDPLTALNARNPA